MITLAFIIIILTYVFLCVKGVDSYFYLQSKNMSQTHNKLKKNIVTYLLFVLFVLLEIPFAIFFPVWLSEKLMVVEGNSEMRIIFLLFGCLVLGFSIWKGRNSKPKYF